MALAALVLLLAEECVQATQLHSQVQVEANVQ